MSMTILVNILLMVLPLSPATSDRSVNFSNNDQFNISAHCQHKIWKSVITCTKLKFDQRDYQLKIDKDPDQSELQFECCSVWDMADCALDTIKKECSVDDYNQAVASLNEYKNSERGRQCGKFAYHSDECTTIWNTKLKPDKKNQPWSDHCQKVINKAGVECRDIVIGKYSHNTDTIVVPRSLSELAQTRTTHSTSDAEDCCPLLEAINCLEAQVMANCTQQEYKKLHDIDQGELQLACPDLDKSRCHLDFPGTDQVDNVNKNNNFSSKSNLSSSILLIFFATIFLSGQGDFRQ